MVSISCVSKSALVWSCCQSNAKDWWQHWLHYTWRVKGPGYNCLVWWFNSSFLYLSDHLMLEFDIDFIFRRIPVSVSQSLSRSNSHIALEAVFSKSKCQSLCGCIVHIDSVHGSAGTYYLDASPVHKWSSPWQLKSKVSVEPWKQKLIIAGSCWSVMVRSLIFGPEARFWMFIFDQILLVIQF